jgi:uncharacterized protein
MGLNYFFDTYAFYELIKGNPNYEKYDKAISVLTTRLNLMELHYGLLRDEGEAVANDYYKRFLKFCVEIDDMVIKEANKFKLKHRKRKLSYVDCIGYVLAKKFNARFLTGDKEFKDLDGVDFVK